MQRIGTGAGRGRAGWARRAALGLCLAGALISGAAPTAGAQQETTPPAGPLGMDDLVRIALERNLNLIQAQQRVEAARGVYTSTYSGLLPNARASYSFRRDASNTNHERVYTSPSGFGITLPPGTAYSSSYNLVVSGQWNLLDAPSLYSHSGARYGLEAERYAYTRTRSQMALAVKNEYFALVGARELAKVSEEALTLAQDQLKRAQSLFQLGSVARSDVLQAQVNAAAAERQLIVDRNGVEQQAAALNQLLAYPIPTSLTVADPPAITDSVSTASEESLIRTAEQNRADYLQAKADLRSAELSEASNKALRYPSLVGGYDYTKSGSAAADPLKRVGKDASWGFNLGLSLDLFDGLRTKGAIQQAKANRRAAERAVEAVRLQLALDVRSALLGIKAATEGIRSAREGVNFAEESVRLQRALYENGGGTLLEWNNAQVELTRARQALIVAEIELRRALAGLENATGQDAR